MKRGQVWIISGGADYMGKPRPAVVIQADRFADLNSAVMCPLTTDRTDAFYPRPEISPSSENGLRRPCYMMIDKLAAIPKSKLGSMIGALADEDLGRLDRGLLLLLGLAQ